MKATNDKGMSGVEKNIIRAEAKIFPKVEFPLFESGRMKFNFFHPVNTKCPIIITQSAPGNKYPVFI